jgi:hypothetical protein
MIHRYKLQHKGAKHENRQPEKHELKRFPRRPAPEGQGQSGYDGHIAQRAYHPGDNGIHQEGKLARG